MLVTVTSTGAAPGELAAPAPRALVFLLGLSERLRAADARAVRAAVGAAVDSLDEGACFAVVAGADHARMLYPDTLRPVRATAETKAEARAALAGSEPAGSAAFGRWLRLTDRTRRAAARTLALRIAVLDGCRVRFLKQLTPSVDDLTVRGHPVGPGSTAYPVDVPDGASYGYHLRFDLPDGRGGDRVGAELSIVLLPPTGDGQTLVRVPVTARRRP
ncbi:hypothetical protein ACN6AT_04870 [Streptomyces sp. JL4002]|uniref:hypothetical protein n=1 Tax=Streptomyces sp. JL4002 TaxID=3404781 RepID=UPI003B28D3C2